MNDLNDAVLYKRHPVHVHLFCGDNGDIYNLRRYGFICKNATNNGYRTSIVINGKALKPHRLTLEAHIGASVFVVDHINGNRSDNRLCNLEYVTSRENIVRAISNGQLTYERIYGEGNPKAKLTEKEVLEILAIGKYRGYTRDLSIKYNVDRSTIERVMNGKMWKHLKRAVLEPLI